MIAWIDASPCQRDCHDRTAGRLALLVLQGLGPAWRLRFPLPVRFLNLVLGKALLCTVEVAFSPATKRRVPGRRCSAGGSAVAWSGEVALERFEMAVIGQVEVQRGEGDIAFGQGSDIRVGRGL